MSDMSELYLLKNQDGRFLDKHGEWVPVSDAHAAWRTTHKDEAINQKVELAVKHPELRIHLEAAKLDGNGKLLLKDTGTELELN